jgi:glycosyltransferase involved in cell wall biosynthesis
MIGTRGVPARYGGFETAVEEVGRRLAGRGHDVVVYCRGDTSPRHYLGMKRVLLPAIRRPAVETLSHSAFSVGHLAVHRCDAAIVFNAANAVLLPAIRLARIPVAVHVDGLEWQRAKWGQTGRRWYLWSERLAVRWADELIADSPGIQDYYRSTYAASTRLLAYGAPLLGDVDPARLSDLGLDRYGYHLVVARLEPENHVDMIVDAYRGSSARLPLIIVGSVPYASRYQRTLTASVSADHRIRMFGSVWDQELLNALYAGAASYLHGHSVGGTNPSLLRAMGAGAPTMAYDVSFNRDVLGETGRFFTEEATLRRLIEEVEADPVAGRSRGAAAWRRASIAYRWDDVALGYERMLVDLAGRRGDRGDDDESTVIDLRPSRVTTPSVAIETQAKSS